MSYLNKLNFPIMTSTFKLMMLCFERAQFIPIQKGSIFRMLKGGVGICKSPVQDMVARDAIFPGTLTVTFVVKS